MPNKDTWILWYCLVSLGAVASFALWGLAGIPFAFSLWITIPAFLLVGSLAAKWWMDWMDKRATIASTPIAFKEVPGLGTLRQLPEGWELDLLVADRKDHSATVPVTFDCGSVGPSNHQVQLVREFARKYSVLLPELIARLESHLAGESPPCDFASVDVRRHSVHVYSDDEPENLEVSFETQGQYSDMYYVLALNDWKIIDVYGAD